MIPHLSQILLANHSESASQLCFTFRDRDIRLNYLECRIRDPALEAVPSLRQVVGRSSKVFLERRTCDRLDWEENINGVRLERLQMLVLHSPIDVPRAAVTGDDLILSPNQENVNLLDALGVRNGRMLVTRMSKHPDNQRLRRRGFQPEFRQRGS